MRRKPGDRIATSWRTRIVPRALACPMNTRERPPFSRPNIAPVRPSSFDWMPRERHTRARATRFSHLTGSHSLQVARRLAATPVRGERVTGPQNSSSGGPVSIRTALQYAACLREHRYVHARAARALFKHALRSVVRGQLALLVPPRAPSATRHRPPQASRLGDLPSPVLIRERDRGARCIRPTCA